jgi:exodeoxyribonuclease VII small subunit
MAKTGPAAAPGAPAAPVPPPPESFEQALSELEALVRRMEEGELTLEGSLAAYRRGAGLVAFCRQSLADVQQQVKVLEGDLLRPFEADPAGQA